MTEKARDRYNRWRSVTVAFRVSPEENNEINRMVKLSGLTKQEYIMKRLECKDVIVVGNPRVYKGLKALLEEIYEQLVELNEQISSPDHEFLETIQIVAKVIDEMRSEGGIF